MKGVFFDNIRDAKEVLMPKKYKVEFPMCGHPELMPTMWRQPKPEPARTIGACPIHNYGCPVCGFGAGSIPDCGCPEQRD